MEQKWYFPKDNGGDQKGWQEQGINHFKSSPYGKLAREIIQNSYDAKREECDQVVVKFELTQIPKEKALNTEFIVDSIQECSKYFPKEEKLSAFLEKAKKDIQKEYINILKISDYNTTGLNGIDTRDESSWYGLVRSTGNSPKNGTSGGSYGSGKHAPFVFSNFRTVFYGTFVKNEGFAFQGKSILCAHEMDGELKTNVGYYGNVNGNSCTPIRNPLELDEYYRRDEEGTDVYIVGANMKANWFEEIMLSIVENFWKVILESKLVIILKWEEVQIQVNSQNIEILIRNLAKKNKKIDDVEEFTAHKFLEVNNADIEYIYGSICEENDIRIKIMKLANSLEKKILLMRDKEMKIYIKDMRKRQIGFWAIFEATGKRINEILRESEPQTHDKWDVNNIEDEFKRKQAKRCINRIEDWIDAEIDKLLYIDDSEEVEVEGLDMFLMDDDEVEYEKYNNQNEEEDIFDNRQNEIIVEQRIESTSRTKKNNRVIDKNSIEEPTDGGNEEGGDSLGQGGNNEHIRTGEGNNTGKEEGQNTNSHGDQYHVINLPFIGTPYDDNKKIQKLILKSNKNIPNAKVALYKVGDSGDNEVLRIKSASCKGIQLKTEKNIIEGIEINGSTSIDIELEEDRKYIMEVKVYVQS